MISESGHDRKDPEMGARRIAAIVATASLATILYVNPATAEAAPKPVGTQTRSVMDGNHGSKRVKMGDAGFGRYSNGTCAILWVDPYNKYGYVTTTWTKVAVGKRMSRKWCQTYPLFVKVIWTPKPWNVFGDERVGETYVRSRDIKAGYR